MQQSLAAADLVSLAGASVSILEPRCPHFCIKANVLPWSPADAFYQFSLLQH